MPFVRKSRGTNFVDCTSYQSYTSSGVKLQDIAGSRRPSTVQEIIKFTPHHNVDGIKYELGNNIDPYAHFLAINRGAFQDALKDRGYPDLPPDRGHAFVNRKWEYLSPTLTGSLSQSGYTRTMTGGQLSWRKTGATPLLGGWGYDLGSETVPELEGFAQRALVDAKPSIAEFSLSHFLGEIREGLPNPLPNIHWKDTAQFVRGVGKDYVNVQFGWEPLLSSLRDFGYALVRAQHKLNTIQGVPIRRHVKGPRSQQSRQHDGVTLDLATGGSQVVTSQALPGYGSAGYSINNVGTGTVLETIDSRFNFAGSFVTLLPKTYDDTQYLDRYNKLVDVNVTPSVLWALSPWSWLVDWFLDIQGTIDANLAAGDETLLIHYAYASYKAKYRQLIWGEPHASYKGDRLMAVTEGTLYRRVRANPYGFTVGTFGGLNADQLAILGALGLSRGR